LKSDIQASPSPTSRTPRAICAWARTSRTTSWCSQSVVPRISRSAHVVECQHPGAARRPIDAHPSTLQAFLEDVAGLSRAGKLTRPGLPKPTALLEAALLAHHYRDMVTLLFPSPPPVVQRLLFPPLARVAQRRGHRAGEFATLA
jgi:hypothetical protein